jgi:hypothetical protein
MNATRSTAATSKKGQRKMTHREPAATPSELIGQWQIPATFTRDFGDGNIYHGCHLDEQDVVAFLNSQPVPPRSEYHISLSNGLKTLNGAWWMLNEFQDGDFFGQARIEVPGSELAGRHVLVFRRIFAPRFDFVEIKAPFAGLKILTNDELFELGSGQRWHRKPEYRYYMFLRTEVPTTSGRIRPVAHPKCVAGLCQTPTNAVDAASELFAKVDSLLGVAQMPDDDVRPIVDRYPDLIYRLRRASLLPDDGVLAMLESMENDV